MSAIVPFQFEDQAVRVRDLEGQPWFVLADVCRVLNHSNPSVAARRLDDDERDDLNISDAMGREQATTVINESGLYRLILTARTAAAKRFRKWVTSEVLPAIRRTGHYGAPAAPLDLNDAATLRRLLLDHTGHTLSLEQRVEHLEPKAAALERLTDAEGALVPTDAAKALDLQPRQLFDWLERNGWIYRRAGGSHWIGYQSRIQAGLLTHKVHRVPVTNGPDKFREQVMITPKGMARLAIDLASPLKGKGG